MGGMPFVKTNPSAPAQFFEWEAAGLRWLAEAEEAGGARCAEVLLVEPGPFQTEFTHSLASTASTLPAYADTVAVRIDRLRNSSNRPGDPVRAAAAIITAVTAAETPHRLVLGANALREARAKLETMKRDFDSWEQVTLDADYPESRTASR